MTYWLRSLASMAPLALLGMTGCRTVGPYIWAQDLPAEEYSPTEYIILPGDVVSVRVFNQDAMATRARVRSDGKISMPFLGDISVQGKAPPVVAKEIEVALKNIINAPNVTVAVEEFRPTTVSVIGEVAHPGVIPIGQSTGLLEALATAGGLTENASKDEIFVLREGPVPRRIRFTYDLLTQTVPSRSFRLRSGDVVVVE